MNTPSAELVILEQPIEKFRFRYKSEMHGTHGSLTGERSVKIKKTFPEVELRNFNKSGIIRCSLYQANTTKPSLHSHLLVVHKEEKDISDPHDVAVSPDSSYIVRFENMGIIHTAKKDVSKELLLKKIEKFKFDFNCDELSQKQIKSLRDEADREAKFMNLNQARLCFEAFQIVDGGRYEKICEPVYSNVINNLKSALTGELKICRLSIYTSSVEGNDDLILLVEKVNKNNIKVRFFEKLNDEVIWEAYGAFTEADVHHQYAIVVRTPPYRDKNIDNHVNVFIELVRDSDNKRSTPVPFRYKPRNIILARKRRRTSNSSSNMTTSSMSSFELQESMPKQIQKLKLEPQDKLLSESQIINFYDNPNEYTCQFNTFMQQVDVDSDELKTFIQGPFLYDTEFEMWENELQVDGEANTNIRKSKKQLALQTVVKFLTSTFESCSKIGFGNTIKRVKLIFNTYTGKNDNADTIIHDLVKEFNHRDATIVLTILSKLNLVDFLSQTNHQRQTPLHVACMFDHSHFVQPLLELKCDPNIQDINGNTALHIAVDENALHCIDKISSNIISSKLNVNLRNNDGMTPLHLAIRKNSLEFVKILLVEFNASVEIPNSRDFNNALHLAVQQQSAKIVEIILENSSNSSNLNTKNQAGFCAVDLAKTLKEPKRTDILNILIEYLPPSEFIKDEPDFEESSSSTNEDEEIYLISKITETEEVYIRAQIQKDSKLCKNLAKTLSIDNKWENLARQLKLDHLLCIWSDAEAMLKCIVGVENIKLLSLLNAFIAVDKEAASVMSSFLMKHLSYNN